MQIEPSKLQRAVLTLNPKLELVSITDQAAFMTNLSVEDALALAQDLVYTTAHLKALGEGEASDKLQDALSQSWTWLGIARAALLAGRAPANQKLS